MTDDSVLYRYQPSSDRRDIPEWMWGDALAVRIPHQLLKKLYGEPGGLEPDGVAEVNRGEIDEAVKRRVGHPAERPAEPINLTFEDFVI